MANEVYESKEFDRLRGRKFKPYSEGHRRMYLSAIEKIKAEHGDSKVDVFEAGFGIGYGLQQMEAAGILNEYCGVEPNRASWNYVANGDTYPEGRRGLLLAAEPRYDLLHAPFDQRLADEIIAARSGRGQYDEAFCIEVIEHVPMHLHLQFFIALRQMAPRLWFSSPDKTKSKEGVRTTKEWSTLLRQARFDTVTVDQSNWTYLFECR